MWPKWDIISALFNANSARLRTYMYHIVIMAWGHDIIYPSIVDIVFIHLVPPLLHRCSDFIQPAGSKSERSLVGVRPGQTVPGGGGWVG